MHTPERCSLSAACSSRLNPFDTAARGSMPVVLLLAAAVRLAPVPLQHRDPGILTYKQSQVMVRDVLLLLTAAAYLASLPLYGDEPSTHDNQWRSDGENTAAASHAPHLWSSRAPST